MTRGRVYFIELLKTGTFCVYGDDPFVDRKLFISNL